jgi:hypothetical protein
MRPVASQPRRLGATRRTLTVLRLVPFERHPNRDRLAINPDAVAAVESALPSSVHFSGAARIITTTGKEYVVEGGIDETVLKLTGGRPGDASGAADGEIRVTRTGTAPSGQAHSLVL